MYTDLVGNFVKWPPLESVKCLLFCINVFNFFCWINVFKNTFLYQYQTDRQTDRQTDILLTA